MDLNKPTTVLLVEDDAGIVELETMSLERAGFRVLAAGDGEGGRKLACDEIVDIVVLDQKLPRGLTGLQLYRQIRDDGCDVPAILVTGSQDDSLVLEALRAGVRDFIFKTPDFLDQLVPTIARVMRQVETERELVRSQARAEEAERRQQQLEREIQERQRAESAAQEAAARLKAIVETAADGILTLDEVGVVESANPAVARIFGHAPDEIVGQNIAMLLPEPGPADEKPILEEFFHSVGLVGLERELLARKKDGTIFPIEWAVSETLLGKRKVFTSIVRDITERKKAEEELREADRRKDAFLAMLAHELRNPLAPVANAVQILRMEGVGGEHFKWSTDVIDAQVKHMTRMVDDLLDVSRITRGKVLLRKMPLELNSAIQQAIETSRPLLEARRHELSVDLPETPVNMEADLTRLAQIFSNLLNNAAKYTPEGGKISISAQIEAGQVCVRIADTGMGIPKEILPRIFDLFTQADQTLDRSHGGLGIGLTLVRLLVEMHGGHVAAFSEGEGKGSEFVVRLPLGATPRWLEMTRTLQRLPESALPSRRLLVVDDNKQNATSLAVLLKGLGQEVEVAFDGPNALDAAQKHHPEIVLLDIGLPGMDGYEVARRLRETGPAGMLIVAMTGYGKDEDKRRSQEAGFNAHLVKPLNMPTLRQLLRVTH